MFSETRKIIKFKTMTNEEKSKELAHFVLYDNSYESIDRNTYDKCMEMAEWKDEQIKKILITIYSFRGIKNIKGYINEKYKSITGKNIKLPKCMEEELDELAKNDADIYGLFAEHSHHCQVNRREGFYDGFKAGYRKAKEE